MAKTLHQYRAAFSRCHDGAYRQMGLRYIRDAIMLQGRNDKRVAELTACLPMLLAQAEEVTRLRAGA